MRDSVNANSNANFKAVAIYTETGFTVDRSPVNKNDDAKYQRSFYEDFSKKTSSALYTHVFMDKGGYDVSVRFLMDIAKSVIKDISLSPDTDVTRVAPNPSREGLLGLLGRVPFVIGCEFVSMNWISCV